MAQKVIQSYRNIDCRRGDSTQAMPRRQTDIDHGVVFKIWPKMSFLTNRSDDCFVSRPWTVFVEAQTGKTGSFLLIEKKIAQRVPIDIQLSGLHAVWIMLVCMCTQ